jgi:hypothetical protein
MNDLDDAERRYRECLEIRRRLASDSSNLLRQNDVAVALSGLGDVHFLRRDMASAAPYYRESLEIRRSVAAADPNSADYQRSLLVALDRVRRVPGSGVTWRDVLVHMEEMERRGLLRPSDRGFLEQARTNAAREAGTPPQPASAQPK